MGWVRRRTSAWLVLTLAACSVSAVSTSEYQPIEDASTFKSHVGEKVQIEGSCASTIAQHLVGGFESHPYSTYFDVGRRQIVIYSKTAAPERGRHRVYGTVVEVRGPPKRPGQPPSKADDNQAEYHLLADRWEAL